MASPRAANIILSPYSPVDPIPVDLILVDPVRGACDPQVSADRRAVARPVRPKSPPGTKAAKTKPDSHPTARAERGPPPPDATPHGSIAERSGRLSRPA